MWALAATLMGRAEQTSSLLCALRCAVWVTMLSNCSFLCRVNRIIVSITHLRPICLRIILIAIKIRQKLWKIELVLKVFAALGAGLRIFLRITLILPLFSKIIFNDLNFIALEILRKPFLLRLCRIPQLLLRYYLILIIRYLNVAFIKIHIDRCIVVINDADVRRRPYRPQRLGVWRSALVPARVVVLAVCVLVWIWVIGQLVGVSFVLLLLFIVFIGFPLLFVKLSFGFVDFWHCILDQFVHLILIQVHILNHVLMFFALFLNSCLLRVGSRLVVFNADWFDRRICIVLATGFSLVGKAGGLGLVWSYYELLLGSIPLMAWLKVLQVLEAIACVKSWRGRALMLVAWKRGPPSSEVTISRGSSRLGATATIPARSGSFVRFCLRSSTVKRTASATARPLAGHGSEPRLICRSNVASDAMPLIIRRRWRSCPKSGLLLQLQMTRLQTARISLIQVDLQMVRLLVGISLNNLIANMVGQCLTSILTDRHFATSIQLWFRHERRTLRRISFSAISLFEYFSICLELIIGRPIKLRSSTIDLWFWIQMIGCYYWHLEPCNNIAFKFKF